MSKYLAEYLEDTLPDSWQEQDNTEDDAETVRNFSVYDYDMEDSR